MTTYQQQLLLEYLGYRPGKLDGLAGENTRAALRAFQRDNGLTPDGICGTQTRQLLKNKIASELPEAETFWKDIRYFTREEFRCPCGRCGGFPEEPAEKLIRIADRVRAAAGKPAHISSGVRCPAHNAEVGGVAGSRHLKGWAMDFCVEGMTSAQLDALVGAQDGVAYHYKIDDRYVHMDVIL